jgi:hypothetical protein
MEDKRKTLKEAKIEILKVELNERMSRDSSYSEAYAIIRIIADIAKLENNEE